MHADQLQLSTGVHVIHPNAVYGRDDLRIVLHLRKSTLGREIREKRLRVSKRAGRYFILGSWVLEWLRAGEITKRATV
jgi:hypothetical protein